MAWELKLIRNSSHLYHCFPATVLFPVRFFACHHLDTLSRQSVHTLLCLSNLQYLFICAWTQAIEIKLFLHVLAFLTLSLWAGYNVEAVKKNFTRKG